METANVSAVSHLVGKYLTFKLDSEDYGIEILAVREIIGVIPVTRVPRMPDYVKGVINLRGKVIPIIDLRLKFGLNPVSYDKLTCIIVVQVTCGDISFQVGIVVDTVNEVLHFSENQLEPAPSYGSGLKTDFILAMGKVEGKVKILLDINKILSNEDVALIRESVA